MTSMISLVVLLLPVVGAVLARSQLPLLVFLLLVTLSPLVIIAALACMVRGYRLGADALIVERLGWSTRLSLSGLRSVTGDNEAMHGSWRIFGNGGLFSFSGEFWNWKLRRYRALATDPSRAVVLRYPRRTIVITPHDPQQFIMRARTLLKSAQH